MGLLVRWTGLIAIGSIGTLMCQKYKMTKWFGWFKSDKKKTKKS